MTTHGERFTIDKVGWHTQTPGNTEPPEKTLRRIRILARYLEERGLAERPLLIPDGAMDDDFEIRPEDLTEEGMWLMRTGYDKWLRKVDRGMDPADVSLLDRALAKLRS